MLKMSYQAAEVTTNNKTVYYMYVALLLWVGLATNWLHQALVLTSHHPIRALLVSRAFIFMLAVVWPGVFRG